MYFLNAVFHLISAHSVLLHLKFRFWTIIPHRNYTTSSDVCYLISKHWCSVMWNAPHLNSSSTDNEFPTARYNFRYFPLNIFRFVDFQCFSFFCLPLHFFCLSLHFNVLSSLYYYVCNLNLKWLRSFIYNSFGVENEKRKL